MPTADTLVPLIVSGAPRSGTSLLYNLFDGHSAVNWMVDEGFLFEYLHDLAPAPPSAMIDAVPRDIDALIAGIRDKQILPPLHEDYSQSAAQGSMSEVHIETNWSEDRFRKALSGPRPDDIIGLWRFLSGAVLAGDGQELRRYACMKAPDFGKSTDAALAMIPDARGLVILRDPLRSLDSLKRSRELRGEKLLTWPQFALSVASFHALHERIGRMDPLRGKVIRYEDLLTTPEETVRDIADWLDIPFEPVLLKPTMRGRTWPGISSFRPSDGLETSFATRTVKALTEEEARYIRGALSTFRSEFGYED